MGRTVQVFAYDDTTFAETGEKVQADKLGVRFAFEDDEVFLDLTQANYDGLAVIAKAYLTAAARSAEPRPGKRSRGRRPKEFYEGMRAYAAEHGIAIPHDGEGKNNYPAKLRRDYETFLAEGSPRG